MHRVTVNAPGGPEVLELTETVAPNPGPGEALVKVAYAALNPLDNHARADRIKWNHPGYPFTPGFEFCGLVDAVGEGGRCCAYRATRCHERPMGRQRRVCSGQCDITGVSASRF